MPILREVRRRVQDPRQIAPSCCIALQIRSEPMFERFLVQKKWMKIAMQNGEKMQNGDDRQSDLHHRTA